MGDALPVGCVVARGKDEVRFDRSRSFGADLTIIEGEGGTVTPELIPRMIGRAAEFAAEPGTYRSDQMNHANSLVGYREIGRELLEQMDRPIDTFCAGQH